MSYPFSGVQDRLSTVIAELRLARTLLAVMTGAALAVGGAVMQGLFRNPLAEPGLVGVSAGAALGAVMVMMAGLSGALWIGTAGFWARCWRHGWHGSWPRVYLARLGCC